MLQYFSNSEILLVLIVFKLWGAVAVPLLAVGSNKTNKIVGGYRCSLSQHPYMVSILKPHGETLIHECGGTILSKYWVVTAAHCLRGKDCAPNYFTVFAGAEIASVNSNFNKYAQKSQVKECFTCYEDYSTSKDIALLHLVDPIHHTHNVRYVKLATSNTKVEEACKDGGIVMGWGDQYAKDDYGNPIYRPPHHDPFLQCLNTPVIPYSECQKKLRFHDLSINSFCAYKSGKDTCQRDSGGPFMCNGIQYGIVSWGIGCAFEDYPGVYARVGDFEEFIRNTLEEHTQKNTTAEFNIPKLLLFALFIVSLLWN